MAEYIERSALLDDIKAEIENRGMGVVVGQTLRRFVSRQPDADVEPMRHGRCPVCSGEVPIIQDCDNGYSIEVEGEEMSVWDGDKCVAIFSIEYCPNCGAKMDADG